RRDLKPRSPTWIPLILQLMTPPNGLTLRDLLQRMAPNPSLGGGTMSWQLEGSYFETCSCDVVCPCTASLALGATKDRCNATLVFHIKSGEVEGVDVSGLTVAAIADTPKVMSDGNWRLGVVIDQAASEEQADKLGAVVSGALGAPMSALEPLVGENLGVERL